jgi:hypothetical protein
MTVYVIRDGELVEKHHSAPRGAGSGGSPLSAPHVSRMQPFESPVTGKEISSWRERDRDMTAAGAVDPRDLDRRPFETRRQQNERPGTAPFEWR